MCLVLGIFYVEDLKLVKNCVFHLWATTFTFQLSSTPARITLEIQTLIKYSDSCAGLEKHS